MDVVISGLREEDTDALRFIKNRLSEHWNMTEDEVQNDWIQPSLQNQSFPYIFIARFQDCFAGKIFLILEENGYLGINHQPWITALFVKEEFRGLGIAQQLIQTAKDMARNNGFHSIYLDTASSQGYYDRIGGWDHIGTARWEEGNKDVFIMRSST